MKRFRQLEFLIFKLGGVAGAVRRLVYRWKGVFTSSLIRMALAKKYPLLEPAPFQIHDTLDWMRQQNRILVVCNTAWELVYKIAPYQLQFKFA